MSKSLKSIVLAIAQLSPKDQRWIVRRLSRPHQETFKQKHGPRLLQEAQRFSGLKMSQTLTPSLPHLCTALATQSPLYAAIILEQGDFPWRDEFLHQWDKTGQIRAAMHRVSDIKRPVKQALWSEWEHQWSFESYLEH